MLFIHSVCEMSLQLAQYEDSSVGGFAVIEYETAEQAEEVQQGTDGLIIHGRKVHVSYCAPGAPGRGTLATLIAAQRMVRVSITGGKTCEKCID